MNAPCKNNSMAVFRPPVIVFTNGTAVFHEGDQKVIKNYECLDSYHQDINNIAVALTCETFQVDTPKGISLKVPRPLRNKSTGKTYIYKEVIGKMKNVLRLEPFINTSLLKDPVSEKKALFSYSYWGLMLVLIPKRVP